jgi:hypothetical protein
VVSSNETRINHLCSNGISWCWIRDKKNLPISIVKQTIKHGGGSVMLWSCPTAKEVGSLYKIGERLNVVHYLELLQEVYITLIDFDFDFDEVIFQQTMHLPARLKLYRNAFGSNHTLLWTGLLNY